MSAIAHLRAGPAPPTLLSPFRPFAPRQRVLLAQELQPTAWLLQQSQSSLHAWTVQEARTPRHHRHPGQFVCAARRQAVGRKVKDVDQAEPSVPSSQPSTPHRALVTAVGPRDQKAERVQKQGVGHEVRRAVMPAEKASAVVAFGDAAQDVEEVAGGAAAQHGGSAVGEGGLQGPGAVAVGGDAGADEGRQLSGGLNVKGPKAGVRQGSPSPAAASSRKPPGPPDDSRGASDGLEKESIRVEVLLQMITDAEKNILLLNRVRMRTLEELEQARSENEVLQGQVKVLDARLKEADARLKLLAQVKAKNQVLQDQVSLMQGRLDETSSDVKLVGQLKSGKRQLEGQVEELEEALVAAKAELEAANVKAKKLQGEVEGRAGDLERLESEKRALVQEVEGLKAKVAHLAGEDEEVDAVQEEEVELRGQVSSLRGQLASAEEKVEDQLRKLAELDGVQAEKGALAGKVRELEVERARLQVEGGKALEELQTANVQLTEQVQLLQASAEEFVAERLVWAETETEKEYLKQQVEVLKDRVSVSDAEMRAQLQLYQREVEAFQESLQSLKVEAAVAGEAVVAVPVGEMPWEFWSNLLLRVDALMLHNLLTVDQGLELRMLAWQRDARIRDAYEEVQEEKDERLVADGLLVLVQGRRRPGMHIVHIAAEMAPVAKVGGLADVVTGLGRALQKKGHLVEFILPKYDCMDYSRVKDLKVLEFELESYFDGQNFKNRVWRGIVEGLPVYFVEPHHPGRFFWRGAFYGQGDDFKRFTYFCRAALELLLKANKRPDIVHCHDWQTAAVAPLYYEVYKSQGLTSASVVMTCHNFEYQGTEGAGALASCGLSPQEQLRPDRMQDNFMHDRINLLKGGIVYSNAITTVSPTYAQEVRAAEGGRGLHPTLLQHEEKFSGILNGIDCEAWDPNTDPMLEYQFSADTPEGKHANKMALKARLGMSIANEDEHRPLVGCVTRLVPQKGVHLIRHSIYRTLERGGQFVLLGNSPVPSIQSEFEQIARHFSNNPHVRLILKYDEGLSHMVYAASDMFVIPSMFEPCGLTQLISFRYGAIPVVRKTGGLNDSVFDVDDKSLPDEKKNGFTFSATDEQGLNSALDRAMKYYWERPAWWRKLVKKAMEQDFSWEKPSEQYVKLYESVRARVASTLRS